MSTHYAECVDCDAQFADADAAAAHRRETFEASRQEAGSLEVGVSSHTTTVVNPTPEEKAESKIRSIVHWAVEDAITDAIDSLLTEVNRESITEDQVREHLRAFPDFLDAWDEADA